MPESRDPRSIVDAAEQAAAAGDYASTERLLREAALLQEAELGPLHPDLANTLNNLGVVCEIRDNPTEAESCFRRAYAIAIAVLEPDHPFVATSRQNLSDFCETRGQSIESPAPAPPVPVEPTPAELEFLPESSIVLPSERPLHVDDPLPAAPPRSTRRFAIAALSLVGLALVVAFAIGPWSRSGEGAGASPVSTSQAPAENPTPPREPLPVAPIPAANQEATTSPGPTAVPKTQAVKASGQALPTVVNAQLCRALSTASRDWQCDRPSNPVDGGALFFYTRLKSARNTTVHHRWYRGEQLRQAGEHEIRASPTEGYRTYSRRTVDGPGEWRVELRSQDGMLLHVERFVVR